MNHLYRNSVRSVTTILALACAFSATAAPDAFTSGALTTADASGWLRTFTPAGTIDTGNPFFQSLGTNGRSCNSCHRQAQGWTVTPAELQQRFSATQGTDPIFRTNDGSVSPFADVSTVAARRNAYAMLLNRGLIRVGLPIPANAQFSLTAVDDPYHYASAAELSLFRRPLPATNLGFLTTVMWDGRETAAPFLPPMDAGVDSADLDASLTSQAKDAVLGHAQGAAAPSAAVLAQIVAFESSLSTAQIRDDYAGLLNNDDALGGPRVLANLRFHVGINDALGADPTGAAFDPSAMHLFDAWATQHGNGRSERARAAIQRGEVLFNTFPITITGVAGLNDVTGQPSIQGHCSTCHDTPNVGNHSVGAPLDIGLTVAARRTPDMPLYTLTNNQTGASVQTTDPGRALLTGKWADIGKFKGAILRGLAARAPYFHNGSAATLMDVVNFYDTRFNIGLDAQQKQDLAAFLAAL
ncbi:MAG TPA: cytochrome c peroxidase [Rudaea sp.]|jgi:cytochrome c peroxidase|nr:cytochrome c peroxidase [Rudaea sp.]